MENINFKNVQSAVINVDNSTDTTRVYDISARVSLDNKGEANSIDNGSILKDKNNVGGFSSYSTQNMSINYNGVEQEEQEIILSTVNAFVASIREYCTNHTLIWN